MMPLGRSRSIAGAARLEGDDLAIDTGLADAAGDQLGDLTAEVEDEDRVGGG